MKLIKEFELGTYGIEEDFKTYTSLLLECTCTYFILVGFVDRCGSSPSEKEVFYCPCCGSGSYKIVTASFPCVEMIMGSLEDITHYKLFKKQVSIISNVSALVIQTMKERRSQE